MGSYKEKAKASRPREGFIPNPKLKLVDQLSEVMRFKHYSLRTERTYREWVRRYLVFHGKRHPRELGAAEVERFLRDLAVRRKVAASTQHQAFNALLHIVKLNRLGIPVAAVGRQVAGEPTGAGRPPAPQ